MSLVGLTGGLIASTAYPDNAIWIAIFPATAIMLYAIVSSSTKSVWVVGLITGFTFYAAQIPWMTVYLGPVPWLALSTLEGVIFAIGAFAINRSWQAITRQLHRSPIVGATMIASLWVAREWISCNFPYGGFPWSRLALSQSNSPMANWVYWGGDSLLSFVIVFIVVLVMLTWTNRLRPANWGSSPVATLLALLVLVPFVTPTDSRTESDAIEIAAVQGNANAGLFANPRPGSILENHLNASASLLEQTNKPDLVIWPENAADQNPLGNSASKSNISNFVDQMGVPLMFGTITSRGEEIYNSSILWKPNIGAVDWYDKKRPVAFGEFVPDRAFFRLLAPDLIDLIPRGYSFGTKDGIFDIAPPTKAATKIGTMICFEVAVDDITRELVHQGAQILVVQTNNSDFGTTNESAQQLAIAKLRAIESGRAVVNISTVGLSAIVLPSGEVVDSLPAYKPGLMQGVLPTRSSLTPAMTLGGYLEIVNNFAALGEIVFVFWLTRRVRRSNV
ncbi:MAG: apolipoprotein N-acyltransferase [Micrococcales bacterium]